MGCCFLHEVSTDHHIINILLKCYFKKNSIVSLISYTLPKVFAYQIFTVFLLHGKQHWLYYLINTKKKNQNKLPYCLISKLMYSALWNFRFCHQFTFIILSELKSIKNVRWTFLNSNELFLNITPQEKLKYITQYINALHAH